MKEKAAMGNLAFFKAQNNYIYKDFNLLDFDVTCTFIMHQGQKCLLLKTFFYRFQIYTT